MVGTCYQATNLYLFLFGQTKNSIKGLNVGMVGVQIHKKKFGGSIRDIILAGS